MRTILAVAFVAVFAMTSLLAVQSMVAQAESAAVKADKLGLSKVSVFETPAPDATVVNTSEPGDRPAVPRSFPEQPPIVPHGIVEFLPITIGDNQCMDCHEVEEKEAGEPTPVPESHYVDYRNAPGATGDELAGARYICTSCHVSPGGNAPLVENTYGE